MPDYSLTEGTTLKKGDICGGCHYYPSQCKTYSDLRFLGKESQFAGTTIVLPADVNGREGYLGCQGFRKYVAPQDKVDRDPDFGKRIPVQLWNLEHGNAPNEPQRLR